MILRSSARCRNSLLSAASCLNKHQSTTIPFRPVLQSRQAHDIPSLGKNNDEFHSKGVGSLYSPQGFEVAWKQYQNYILDRLNTMVAGSPYEADSVKKLLLRSAREPTLAATFNHSSMAHNNFFFFKTLAPERCEMPQDLEYHVSNSFSSVDSLRSTFLATASAMFGPGFVWLVQTLNPSTSSPSYSASHNRPGPNKEQAIHLRILTTYLAGSPYPGAHYRQQNLDMNVQNRQSLADYERQNHVQNTAGFAGQYSPGARSGGRRGSGLADIELGAGPNEVEDVRKFGGAEVIPLLCVNTWEHAYMTDWGVAGKREYLAKWWDHVDWEQVNSHCDRIPFRGFHR